MNTNKPNAHIHFENGFTDADQPYLLASLTESRYSLMPADKYIALSRTFTDEQRTLLSEFTGNSYYVTVTVC